MNHYETIIIFSPDGENIPLAEIKKFKKILQEFSHKYGKCIDVEDMGVKRLAYRIKDKFDYGRYAVYKWVGTGENVVELERQLRIDDHVIKFLTVRHEDDIILKDYDADDIDESEQETPSEPEESPNKNIDAMDVLLGLAKYV